MLLLLGAGVAEQLVLLLSFCGRVRIPMLVSQEGYNARVERSFLVPRSDCPLLKFWLMASWHLFCNNVMMFLYIFKRLGWGGGGATESCIDNRSCICIQIGFISPYYWARSERIGSKFSAVGSTEWHSECRIFNRLILKDKFKTGAHWTKKLNSPELFFSNCLKTVRRTLIWSWKKKSRQVASVLEMRVLCEKKWRNLF